MKFAILLFFINAALLTQPVYSSQGGSGGGMTVQPSTKMQTPQEKAAVSYKSGLKHSEKAAKYELQAIDQTNEKKLAKLQGNIAKEYNKAIDDFEKSIDKYPGFYESFSSLGFALRKVGRYDESLIAYNQALKLNPLYDEAIEYRGEAYLGLNRLEEVKQAYVELFQRSPDLSNQLMAAMIDWVAKRRVEAGGLDAEVIENFTEWVEQRNALTSFIHPMGDASQDRWADTR